MMLTQFSARLGIGSAAALLACATLAAQNPGGMPSQQPQMPQQTQPGMAGANTPTANGSTPSMADQAFVSNAMQGNLAEVQLGQLAQQKSQSQDVKQFAQKMVSEHNQMNDKWFDKEAKALDVSVPKSPSKKDKKLIEKLQGLSGDEFDKEYINAMLKDHQDDLKKFKEESESAQDPNVKQIAQLGTKVISEHLQLAEQMAKNHNIPVEGAAKEVSSR